MAAFPRLRGRPRRSATAFESEQFRLHERRRNRAAVDGNERIVCAPAERVDGFCDQLLSSTAFTRHEDADIRRRDPLNAPEQFAHDRCGAHDLPTNSALRCDSTCERAAIRKHRSIRQSSSLLAPLQFTLDGNGRTEQQTCMYLECSCSTVRHPPACDKCERQPREISLRPRPDLAFANRQRGTGGNPARFSPAWQLAHERSSVRHARRAPHRNGRAGARDGAKRRRMHP